MTAHRPSLLWPTAIATGALALGVFSVFVRLSADPADADEGAPDLEADRRTGAVLIDFRDDASEAQRAAIASELSAFGIAAAGTSPLGDELEHGAQLYRLRAGWLAERVVAALSDDVVGVDPEPELDGVELEGIWSLPRSEPAWSSALPEPVPADREPGRFVPNDPYYRHQWHLDQIDMPAAWGRERGEGVVVAVIDSGVAYRTEGAFMRAPDLAGTAFVPGWDFVDDDGTPDDEHGHGTHCAGTIAQATDNGLGVAGVAPGAAIMPIRVLDESGAGGWGGIAAGIRWAADHGADVISMSLGGGTRSRTVERAIDHAHERGVVIIAAAGNESRAAVSYPARHEHVVAVGAVRLDRELTFYSSYGDGLDVVAPGGDIRVDQNGDGLPDGVLQNTLVGGDPRRFDYLAWQGTSMATPHVAGIAALLVASGVTDPDRVEQLLESSATDLGDHRRYGHGLVSASAALHAASHGAAGARGLTAAGLAAALLLALRRRGKLAIGLGAPVTLGFVIAGGLGALPWEWLGLGAVGQALAGGALGAALSSAPWAGPVAASAMVPVALALVLAQSRRLVPLLGALAFGVAGWLVVEAIFPTARLALIPEALVGPWLLANAALAAFVGRQLARRPL